MGYTDTKAPGDLTRGEVNQVFGATPKTSQGIYQSPAGGLYTGKTEEDAFGSSTTYTPATKEDIAAVFPEYQNQVDSFISQLKEISQGIDSSTAPVAAQYYSQTLKMIDDAETAMIARYEKMGSSVDPATQAALTSLKDTVKKQRDSLMDEMSRRGLLQSGIWAQSELDLNKGELNSQQQLLGTRLSALQEQLNAALNNLTQSKISASGQLARQPYRRRRVPHRGSSRH